jgi:transcriptional regulator GlxA family with amidase domain
MLARLAPNIRVEADAIYVVDGSFYTSAGVTAGIDLALALVEEDLGREVASRIARDMVLFLRRSGGQSQYSVLLAGQASDGHSFADLISWVGEHPGSNLTVGALARRVGMSERTFMRAFLRETGATPASLVRRVRVDCARRHLETTVWPMKKVAEKAGFGSEDSLVRAFRSVLGATPETVRAGFKARPNRRD